METYPCWTDEQKSFERRIDGFVEEIMPLDAETKWKREVPWESWAL